MDWLEWGFLALVFLTVSAVVAGAALVVRPDGARERLRALSERPQARSSRWAAWLPALARWVAPVSGLAIEEGGLEQSNIQRKLAHAGIRHASAVTVFFGCKSALTLALPVLALIAMSAMSASASAPSGTGRLLVMLLCAAVGYYGPNVWLNRQVEQRQREVFEAFPDALDLMTVCVEAGLGTDAALLRVADDMGLRSPALAEELRLVNLELQAGGERSRALRNLATRTGVEEVESFVSMLNQAERFGTSIAASLRIHSTTLRTRRRQKAEEAAAKIALKLLFPLMVCIFPALMVVLVGPAFLQLSRGLLSGAGL
jgi:tight adherence protein C